jgi:hypothetical protein
MIMNGPFLTMISYLCVFTEEENNSLSDFFKLKHPKHKKGMKILHENQNVVIVDCVDILSTNIVKDNITTDQKDPPTHDVSDVPCAVSNVQCVESNAPSAVPDDVPLPSTSTSSDMIRYDPQVTGLGRDNINNNNHHESMDGNNCLDPTCGNDQLKEGIFLNFIENDDLHVEVVIEEKVEILKKERIYNTTNIHLARLIRYRSYKNSKLSSTAFLLWSIALVCILPAFWTHALPGWFLYLWCFSLIGISGYILFFVMIVFVFIPFLFFIRCYLYLRKQLTFKQISSSINDNSIQDFYFHTVYQFLVMLFFKLLISFSFIFCIQVAYNYASLYYNGYSYLDVISQEFLLRSQLTCFLDHSFEKMQQSLSFFSWL